MPKEVLVDLLLTFSLRSNAACVAVEIGLFKYGYGAYVQEVVPGSPAEGILKIGDIIIKMDFVDIKWKLLATKVKSKKIGDKAYFVILRDGELTSLTFIMDKMKG